MKRLFPAMALVAFAAFAVGDDCQKDVSEGCHRVELTAHYAHVSPHGGEETWSSSVEAWHMGPAIVTAAPSEGCPIGCEWVVEPAPLWRCEPLIFEDGFEAGTLSAWGAP